MVRATWLSGEIRVENLRQPLSPPDKASLAPAPPARDSRVPCPVAASAVASPCHAGASSWLVVRQLRASQPGASSPAADMYSHRPLW